MRRRDDKILLQVEPVTRLLTRRCYDVNITDIGSRAAILFFDVGKFNQIDDSFGHSAGTSASGMSRNSCEVRTENTACVTAIIRALRANDSRMPGVSMGYAYYDSASSHIQNAVEEADAMLYKNKSAKS